MVSDETGSEAAASRGLSEEDLLFAKKIVKLDRTICVIALAACVGAAIFVFMNVPADTRVPYDGKYDRSGAGIPMQIALLLAPAFLLKLWWSTKKKDAHRMSKKGSIGSIVLGSFLVAVCVLGQSLFVKSILTVGGYFTG
ncbi:hypothetical protein ACIPVK_09525 [Paeniglutamicibacter sp. MACA_103]|uniref:hypothetical protein n=1 Tax=Paeniglutamicibacter sp. MACA_103 TaxID=3377337 RepID=UPI003892E04F